jgi:hypothetical protein
VNRRSSAVLKEFVNQSGAIRVIWLFFVLGGEPSNDLESAGF